MVLVHLHHDLDLIADEVQLADRADLDAGDPHRRPFLEPAMFGEHAS